MSVFIRRHGDSTKKWLFKNGVLVPWSTQKHNTNGDATVSDVIHVGGFTLDILNGWGKACISSPVDLTSFSKLCVHITEDVKGNGFPGNARVYVGASLYGEDSEKIISYNAANTTVEMDISAITGSKYITLYAQANGYTEGTGLPENRWIKADKVWLEI